MNGFRKDNDPRLRSNSKMEILHKKNVRFSVHQRNKSIGSQLTDLKANNND